MRKSKNHHLKLKKKNNKMKIRIKNIKTACIYRKQKNVMKLFWIENTIINTEIRFSGDFSTKNIKIKSSNIIWNLLKVEAMRFIDIQKFKK